MLSGLSPARAHFCTIIPTDSIISANDSRDAQLRPFVIHPFEQLGMPLSKPVPRADVEVEYYNPGKTARAPDDLMITQTVKTDENG